MNNQISFIKPFYSCHNLLLISYQDMVIGSIKFNNSVIIDIDVNTNYLYEIKSYLLDTLLFYLGINEIVVLCDKIYQSYYNELGFIKQYIKGDKMVMVYSVGNKNKSNGFKTYLKTLLNKILGENGNENNNFHIQLHKQNIMKKKEISKLIGK